ncbi:acyltransferase family protein [Butyrivibrio sp. VCB2006]|uniref:acyltransferase family protein n=1 Tax=Butyrivibrio sp. VCB2006 TaxID=1280679 RepID=UPI0004163219|nr:acyltransferase family protein [Butyrivibrio sp. VCB2006]
MEAPKRIDHIDVAKGIAIILVVCMHAVTNNHNVFQVSHPIFLNWMASFAVPTFFFINGFLYKEEYASFPVKTIIKKIKAYYIPYVAYNLFFYVLDLIQNNLLDSSYDYTIRSIAKGLLTVILGKIQPLGGPMWFLRALIVMTVIYVLIDSVSSRLKNGQYRYLLNTILVIACTLTSLTGIVPTTFNAYDGFRYLIIFYLGILYKRFNINTYVTKHVTLTAAISFLCTIIISSIFSVGLAFRSNIPLAYLEMILGIIFVFSLSQITVVSKSRVLRLLGQCSLEIMALHFLAFKPVSYLIVRMFSINSSHIFDIPVIMNNSYPQYLWPLYVLSGLIIPSLFSFYIIKRGNKHVPK